MIGDYYGDGTRYRGLVSKDSRTRTVVYTGEAVLHDTAEAGVDDAIDVVARTIVANLELPEWEHYPDIGEHDWQRIENACRSKLMAIAGSTDRFRAAYRLLEDRAHNAPASPGEPTEVNNG